MKKTLDHLPEHQQHEIRRAAEIIVDTASPAMLILFGSYARSDWVSELAEDGLHYKYQSDFDLIAIVKNEALAKKIERKGSLHNRLHREVKTPVSLIAEDVHFFNRRLSKGQYFYTDILKDGIVLHDTGELKLTEPRELDQKERVALAKEDFSYWFEKANKYKTYSEIAIERDDLNEAAFFLHQSTERYYAAILLVYTRYKPSTHDLQKLSQLVASVEPLFLTIFPEDKDQNIERFELLRKAYVNARYKPGYVISKQQLAWLHERVTQLEALTESLCQAKIDQYNEGLNEQS